MTNADAQRHERSDAAGPPSAPGEASLGAPATAPPSPELALAGEAPGLPGAHRGGYRRAPTGPLDVVTSVGPGDRPDAPLVVWAMPAPAPPRRGVAAAALAFAIAGLAMSLVVGFGFPAGLVAVIAAIVALRRPQEPRGVAVWALVLGALSLVYSAGWLWYAATLTELLA